MRRCLLCCALAVALPAHGDDLPVPAALDMAQPQEVFLDVSLNGQPSGRILRFRATGERLACDAAELASLGLDPVRLGKSGEVRLDDVPGLSYHYDAATQRVELTAADSLRLAFVADARQLARTAPAQSGRGLVLNYDAYVQSGNGARLALWSELRYFAPSGVFDHTGTYYDGDGQHRYVRYDTAWTRSDPTTTSVLQVGDSITSALNWSRPVRFAGVQWRSDFSLRPDLITFPLPALGGSAAVPSAVDLYVNNVRRASVDVPSGPFVLNQAPGISGAGQATLVTRDALGRTVTTALPLYIDARMLAAGLDSYGVEAGFVRRRYGLASFDYASHPSASGSWRHGVNDALTFEVHGEATAGLANAGGGALVRLGQAGVLSGSLALSGGSDSGRQTSIGYQWIRPDLALDAELTQRTPGYADLATREGSPAPRRLARLTVSVPFAQGQNLALSYIALRAPGSPPSRIGALTWIWSVTHWASLNLSAYRDFARPSSSGAFLSLNLALDGRITASALGGSQGGQPYRNLQALRPADYSGGWGWGVQDGRSGDLRFRQAQLQYLGSAGQLTALVQDTAGHRPASLDAYGALVWMDGSLQPARRIYDGFALVSTDGVPDVPVLHENRPIGRTDQGGHLLVPDLNAYQANRLAIDSLSLPADTQVDAVSQDVVPQARSGVLAHFPLSRYAAASIVLVDQAGQPLPAGTRVHHAESGMDTVVGYDGLTFVSGLRERNRLELQGEGWDCSVAFDYRRPADGSLPRIGPLACAKRTEPAR
ncbi:fimbria/pilus outer membrane usher protein [Dyella sp. 2RAB6]|uniref:fimbria/pilus outer membrane usher protein n=1 Tax=Dyella sp. 2RAB6 TaxID=3232992 RepID=UPI003F8FE53E